MEFYEDDMTSLGARCRIVKFKRSYQDWSQRDADRVKSKLDVLCFMRKWILKEKRQFLKKIKKENKENKQHKLGKLGIYALAKLHSNTEFWCLAFIEKEDSHIARYKLTQADWTYLVLFRHRCKNEQPSTQSPSVVVCSCTWWHLHPTCLVKLWGLCICCREKRLCVNSNTAPATPRGRPTYGALLVPILPEQFASSFPWRGSQRKGYAQCGVQSSNSSMERRRGREECSRETLGIAGCIHSCQQHARTDASP